MDIKSLRLSLSDLPLGPIRYYETIGSTNDEAAAWIEAGARDLSLVVADEQTRGRGRLQRRWFTSPQAGLALSLVLRQSQPVDPEASSHLLSRLTGLGAVGVSAALQASCQLEAQIKWPNDVLLKGRKVAGILAEATWRGDLLEGVVLGIGVNVSPQAVPPETELNFPATSVEAETGAPVDCLALLHAILEKIIFWRLRLATPEFLQAWELHLAYKGEWVRIMNFGLTRLPAEAAGPETFREGQLLGLDPSGGLRLRDRSGQAITLYSGEIHLRPLPASDGISGRG
jgi:BirA family transcriptional regulator, biotin operon repressor / biotin---[acetyl-CoA-carboxylase] ligase